MEGNDIRGQDGKLSRTCPGCEPEIFLVAQEIGLTTREQCPVVETPVLLQKANETRNKLSIIIKVPIEAPVDELCNDPSPY